MRDFPEDLSPYKSNLPSHALDKFGVYCIKLGLEQLAYREYNMSITGEEEVDYRRYILQAKNIDIQQYEGHNCGLHCLFAAAMRKGLKEGSNNFNFIFAAKEQLEKVCCYYIEIREEVLRRDQNRKTNPKVFTLSLKCGGNIFSGR